MATPITHSPFNHPQPIPLPPLPPFRCKACSVEHLTNPDPTGWPDTIERRCLYCGCPHRLDGKRWVRA